MLPAITILGKIVSDITAPAKAIARRRNSKKNLQTYIAISISGLDVTEETSPGFATYLALDVDTMPFNVDTPKYNSLDRDLIPEVHSIHTESTISVGSDAASSIDSDATSPNSSESWEDVDDVESVDFLDLTSRFSVMSKEEQHIFNTNQLALGKQASHASIVHVVAVEENENDSEEDQPTIPAVLPPPFIRRNSPLSGSFMSATASAPITVIEIEQPASPQELGELFFAKAHSQRTLAEARARIGRSYTFLISTRAPIPAPSDCFPANRALLPEPKSCNPPSVLAGLGRSSPLRNGWTAEDL